MPIDTNAILQTTLEKSKELAATLFKRFTEQAVSDTNDFLQRSKEGVARAAALLAAGKIDKDDFEDLILGKKDLAEMHGLQQAGLANATIDTFVNGVLQILIYAAFAAIP
jgi:hypothetical protein